MNHNLIYEVYNYNFKTYGIFIKIQKRKKN